MNHQLSQEQIGSFQENGLDVIEDFLDKEEIDFCRASVTQALEESKGVKTPRKEGKIDEAYVINEDSDYYTKVFDQDCLFNAKGISANISKTYLRWEN